MISFGTNLAIALYLIGLLALTSLIVIVVMVLVVRKVLVLVGHSISVVAL